MDPAPGYRFANWERGYGDFHMTADLATRRVASWLCPESFRARIKRDGTLAAPSTGCSEGVPGLH